MEGLKKSLESTCWVGSLNENSFEFFSYLWKKISTSFNAQDIIVPVKYQMTVSLDRIGDKVLKESAKRAKKNTDKKTTTMTTTTTKTASEPIKTTSLASCMSQAERALSLVKKLQAGSSLLKRESYGGRDE